MLSQEMLRKIRAIEIRTRHIVTEVLSGQYHSAFKGSGMEFEEVREYFPGDDVRSIDWNVTARMQHPFIKTYREERELTVFLVVDMSASLQFGSGEKLKQDIAAELAAVLALAAIRNQDKVALILHTDEVVHYIPAGKGPRHVLRVVREILTHQPTSKKTDLEPALTFLNRVAHHKSVVFLIGDGVFPPESLRAATLTARRHDLVSITLHDPREYEWQPVGLVDWVDPESGQRHLIDTSNPKVRKAFALRQQQWAESFERDLRRGGIDPLTVSTRDPYEIALAKFFRQRAARRGK